MDERELIQRCISGDPAAWQEFVRLHLPVIQGLARAALRSMSRPAKDPDVEDVASGVLETLVANAFRVLRSFRWQCSLESWLRVLVRTVCVRSLRRKRVDPRDLPPPENEEMPLDRLLSAELRTSVRNALDALPPREKMVISMFFIDGRSYQEIAGATGLPMGTVATVISRTRGRLRDLLRQRGLGEES